MSFRQRSALLWLAACFALAVSLRIDRTPMIEGVVLDADGPLAGATVGWQGQRRRVVTDAAGRFRLAASTHTRRLTASLSGYCIASIEVLADHATLRLRLLPTNNENYAWIDPHPDPQHANNCANCHGQIYREWTMSAHARSALNPKFLSLYAGKHPTWNARTEHPDGSAVCAACHAPTLVSPDLEYDIRAASGVAKSGIHCDYCHKVADVPTGKFGTRFGRDALRLLRPPDGDLLSFGPLDDAVREGESFAYVPVYKESRYCASCHEGTVFGVHAYGTYSEWLASPARKQGTKCQDCHMAPLTPHPSPGGRGEKQMTNIAPGNGGIVRDPRTLASHHAPGGTRDMLQKCLQLYARTTASAEGISVEVEITAERVGHRVPTGFPDRQLILLVTASDAKGKRVALLDGPKLPASTGNWAGSAGMLYAKQLADDKGRSPVPFWTPIDRVTDTRLHPARPDRRVFTFPASARQATVQLWYRRFWHEVAASRGWSDNDVLVHERRISLPDR